ncbi:type i restriction-modification system methyltransferase subunit [Leptolyngbya sp. Heron Island J]|uniref:N-6 DNA methylase n=1 Tax=Leptolyngbya sp. Heron Island J TaxID=1385935 RepID=UPI0003B94B1C|nr:N-6 DNA methylase [Leptolyngbya sp. Heron Island J]ESA37142.1 type i restriction-modification system methyltransferase subunit [Leptolyngbya sp. Heron Island J]
MSPVSSLKKEFTGLLNSLCRSRSPGSVFSDWLEIAAITLHQLPYHSGDFLKTDAAFVDLEAKYMERIKGYSREELSGFSKMLGCTMMAHQQSFSDFLGEIASEAELLNTSKSGGQFFTPYPICRMMAKMTLENARDIYEEKGLITLCEPASGGGAMVIACAEELMDQGLDPRSCLQVDCTDVSRDAFNMTYIQMAALDLQAVVRHGNTLSMEMWESRPTPQLRYFDQWLKEQQFWHRLEELRDLIVNPDAFFVKAEGEADGVDQQPAPTKPVTSSESAEVSADQPSLFDLETMDTFAAPSHGERQRSTKRQADVALPLERQMDLFANEGNES